MELRITGAVLQGRMVDIDIRNGLISAIREAGTDDEADAGEGAAGPEDGAGSRGAESGTKGTGGSDAPDQVIEAGGNYIIPSLKNGHTHAAMTLLRGFADDMKLQPWLQDKIWPAEAQLEPEDIYWGNRLAAIEMIKSGTTFCNDMYLHFDEGWRAFQDAGIKAAVGPALFDFFDRQTARQVREQNEDIYRRYGQGRGQDRRYSKGQEKGSGKGGEKLLYIPSPHSIYTVSEETLRWVAEFSEEHELPVHIHLSETRDEVENCAAAHDGLRPVEYLEQIGLLSSRLIAAHAIWLNDREIELLARYGVTVVHNPVSNMKLASGSCFPFRKLQQAGVPMMLGTDGCSSNNNLDMFEEMKCAALLQKHHFGDTELMAAREILDIAAGNRSTLFPHLAGEVREGAPADLLLIDARKPEMVPAYNPVSNLVYAANGSAVDTVICGGEVLMMGKKVPGEEEVLERARERARLLVEKTQK